MDFPSPFTDENNRTLHISTEQELTTYVDFNQTSDIVLRASLYHLT